MLRRLANRLFNFPPHPDTPYITDVHGEKYWAYWGCGEIRCALHVFYKGRFIGIVEMFLKDDGTAELTGIEISTHYRGRLLGRGLGKAMLQESINRIRERGVVAITGIIVPISGDIMVTEGYLATWYKMQGFTVEGRYIYMLL